MNRGIGLSIMFTALLLTACGGGNQAPANNVPPAKDAPKPDYGADKFYAANPSDDDAAALAGKGREVFVKFACTSCHSLTERRDALTGPPLGKTGERFLQRHKADALAARRAIYNHIKDPSAYPGFFHGDAAYAGQRMPAFGQINDDDLRALVEFLLSRR